MNKCTIIVVRNTLNNSKPCKKCIKFLKNSGIRKIYYSYEGGLKMEKTIEIETDHVSSKYRKPWCQFK